MYTKELYMLNEVKMDSKTLIRGYGFDQDSGFGPGITQKKS
jgi:hypothetical protein